MNEFKKCPDGFIDIGGICVPKKRVVRRSLNYDSLFAGDSATHNVPDDRPPEIIEDDIITGGGGNDGRDDPTEELVDNGPHTPAERPDGHDHTPVPDDETLTREQMEINYIMGILFRQGNTATLSQEQMQVLADANAEQELSIQQREQYIEYISYLDGVGEETEPDVVGDVTEEDLGYQVIDNFTYRQNSQSVTGGSAHLYDDQIIIFDSDGNRVAVSSVSQFGPAEGNTYITVYNGEAIVYQYGSGEIHGMPEGGSVSDNSMDAEGGHGVSIDG